ncbi:FMN-dependent dehydrogenase, includes L-lactate dehydrogenase and type II isopentenyl diphosphate isomerase [Treponema bryantii]|uniref:FMN-dependent dehydrogenase, includes L-lactate dehydrogenase and type II isopentenyl diphosphate isomerase n=1 Tax=Treponema bryantii TaxID=163 RepID=A0A1H8ZVD8_9SPIR|nr:alpha-hydroxy acid oxidase [Treponema bryantii]SEP68295.1 FMN-dependent dehydrogenase, includes L-lactate dehydrogenase and type II isopentenyl diphosphate isomerase [Treponema bryantii]
MEYTSNSDKITRDYFDSLLLEARYIDSDLPSTKLELYDRTFDTPIMTAALSHLANTAENGMVKYAQAAANANAVHWVGMGEDKELEEITATGAATIKIIKPHADNKEVFRKIEHAKKAGCFAVGMDIDHAFNGSGGYDNVLGLDMKPKSTEELHDFVQAAGIPFIVKGVLSTKDAEKCLKAGCKGIQLSHHHGIMQYAVPPLMMLSEILQVTRGEIPVFIDCGIESGMDVYKCLALGATAVSVGRHLMPLLKKGADATAERIKEMTGELAATMARTGVRNLNSFDPTVIHQRKF